MADILTLSGASVEQYADILSEVAGAVQAGDIGLAEERLEPIIDHVWQGHLPLHAPPGRGAMERTSRAVSERVRANVFARDGFRCTYCGARAVPRCVLVAVSDIFPRFAYDHHYGRGRIHPAFWALAPEVDHVIPHSRGGISDLANLTTLHTFCNSQKSDSLADELPFVISVPAIAAWSGLVEAYPQLVEAGNTRGHRHSTAGYHPRWLRNFNLQQLGPVTEL